MKLKVIFNDKTQLILNSEDKLVMFIGQNEERIVSSLLSALEGDDAEMSKRLKYTKEILTHMVQKKKKT